MFKLKSLLIVGTMFLLTACGGGGGGTPTSVSIVDPTQTVGNNIISNVQIVDN